MSLICIGQNRKVVSIAIPNVTWVMSEMRDAETKDYIVGAQVDVYNERDSLMESKYARGTVSCEGKIIATLAKFSVRIPNNIDGEYRLKISYPGYQDTCVVVSMKTDENPEEIKNLEPIFLKKTNSYEKIYLIDVCLVRSIHRFCSG